PWPHNSNQMASGKPGAVQGDLYDGRSLGIELIFRRYVIVPMTHIQHTEPTHVAADFVELMRSDFERPFELRDFSRMHISSLGSR
ncbi:hypothetical protein, partial [Rhizobium sp.]|uniref:hypothetical protein n=1 Tax=Rhizobium sp. TaxID=391 RepID=UPI00289EDA86